MGLVDLHFHGAYGIDLMSATSADLEDLRHSLAKEGMAGFCATTLSTTAEDLESAVRRLGRWVLSSRTRDQGALPLGIHLEGPFISSQACGAHPPGSIRPLD